MQRKKKEPVKIRVRQLANGNQSLYLDIYLNGERTYETLHLYLIPEKNRGDRAVNDQTWTLAEAAKAKRIVEIQRGQFGFKVPAKEKRLIDFYDELCESRAKKESTLRGWKSARYYIERYDKGRIKLSDIDASWCEGFKRFLDAAVPSWGRPEIYNRSGSNNRPLAPHTKNLYLQQLRSVIAEAYRRGYISENPMNGVESYKVRTTERSYLTIEELHKLVETPCYSPIVRQAFLFSCLTGLRASDIMQILWDDVSELDGYTRITFTQVKTTEVMYLDINRQAAQLMGERPANGRQKVFPEFRYSANVNRCLHRWLMDAGITKHITFHCARHTFAVMMLDLGADLYTVSKLLGHTNISVTQIYAKVIDKNKRKAVDLIPDITH